MHVETVKQQTRIELNLWGVNPLEVTHFKSGFLGIPPDFEGERVYTNGALKQARYQLRRLNAMLASLATSIRPSGIRWGEYHRSFTKKTSYFHIFDYWQWNETLLQHFSGICGSLRLIPVQRGELATAQRPSTIIFTEQSLALLNMILLEVIKLERERSLAKAR